MYYAVVYSGVSNHNPRKYVKYDTMLIHMVRRLHSLRCKGRYTRVCIVHTAYPWSTLVCPQYLDYSNNNSFVCSKLSMNDVNWLVDKVDKVNHSWAY